MAADRITQEALTNVVRHADARQVTISIRVEGETLVVRVRDDGHGAVEPRDGGVGLRAMRERAHELGGHLEVDADPTVGTTITARLPLPPTQQDGEREKVTP